MEIEFLKYLLISIVLGFIIGLERSVSFSIENEEAFAGSRTFSLVSLLGFISSTAVCASLSAMYKQTKTLINTYLEKNPLELNEAIKFAIIFAVIYALIEISNKYYGNTGVFLVSFISGFTDVDAITLTLGEMSKSHITLINAGAAITLASVSNTITKFFIVMFFSRELAKKMLLFFIPEIVILSLFFVKFLYF